jgi:hypothetical protein
MTIWQLLRQCRRLAVFVPAAIFVLASPNHSGAAPAVERPPARTDQTCSISTNSIKQLAVIDKTSEGGFQCLGVFVDGDRVISVRLERHSVTSTSGQPASEQVRILEFPASTIDSIHGAVIDGIPGHDAIVLRGHFRTSPGKAELVLSYLFNGFTGEFHSCPVTIDSTPETGWRLINRFDQTISHIAVKLRQIPVIGTVGIADLEGACSVRDRQSRAIVGPGPHAITAVPFAHGA